MPMNAFISYAHVDERRRERLHQHLAMLRREGLLAEWTDHEILAGDRFADEIDAALGRAGLFIALLSPDYLASKYCYEKEFRRALDLNEEGKLRIVGVVVEPCDWKQSPFSELVVLPKGGKPIAEWNNENTAYVSVVTELRRVLERAPNAIGNSIAAQIELSRSAQPRRLRVKRDFDVIQQIEFAEHSYAAIKAYFKRSCEELPDASEHLRSRFIDLDYDSFTCTIVNRAKTRGGEAHVTVRLSRGRKPFGDISWLWQSHGDDSSCNGWLSVEADDFELYLKGSIDRGLSDRDAPISKSQAAEKLWEAFMGQAGIELAY